MSEFARPTGIDWAGSHYGMVRFGEDNQKVVVFYIRSVENPAKSREEGTRIFENAVYVKIHEPGERLNIVDRPVKDEDKDRFPVQWSRFIHNKTQIPEGTLVDLLFPNNPAVADSLKAHGVYTIQQLAKLSAHAIDNIGMGCQEWVNMANSYLQNASSGVEFIKLQEKIKSLEQNVRIKDDQIEKLVAQVDALLVAVRNPELNKLQPGFIEGHDVQSERINSTHITSDIAAPAVRARTKKKIPIDESQDI